MKRLPASGLPSFQGLRSLPANSLARWGEILSRRPTGDAVQQITTAARGGVVAMGGGSGDEVVGCGACVGAVTWRLWGAPVLGGAGWWCSVVVVGRRLW